MIYNVQIKLTIENYNQITIFYSFNENTTFEDFLEYLIYLIQDKRICHCFSFSYNYNNKTYNINDL